MDIIRMIVNKSFLAVCIYDDESVVTVCFSHYTVSKEYIKQTSCSESSSFVSSLFVLQSLAYFKTFRGIISIFFHLQQPADHTRLLSVVHWLFVRLISMVRLLLLAVWERVGDFSLDVQCQEAMASATGRRIEDRASR